jgi:hypothetical protein
MKRIKPIYGFGYKKGILNILLLLVCLPAIIGIGNHSAQAQPVKQWLADQKVPGYLDDTPTPVLIADQDHTVHVFASQWINDGHNRKQAVVYRKWTLANGWTRPIDILLSPTGDAQILGAFLDSTGVFHVAFWGGRPEEGRGFVYYSNGLVDTYGSWRRVDISSFWYSKWQ